MYALRFLVVSVGLTLVLGATPNCDMDRMDRCAQRIYLYGNPEYKFAENIEEAVAKCAETKKAEICVKNYVKKCVKHPFVKQYLGIMLKGPSGVIKRSCTQQGIRDFLQHKACFNATKSILDFCTNQAVHDGLRVSKASRKDWIAVSCCLLDKSTKCSASEVKAKCEPQSVKYIIDAIDGYNGQNLKILCGQDYEWESQKCVDLMKRVPELEKGTRKPLSIVPVTIDIMEKYLLD